jgi:MFS family permease
MSLTKKGLGAAAHGVRSLGNRNYRLFWFGQLLSLGGTWMQDVALSWLVLSLTDSPVALGLTMAIRFLPVLLFSLHGGVLADRLPKRQTIIVAEVVQLLVALTLAILTSTELVTVTLIYALAAVRGMVDAVEGPTRQAFVPEMVGTEDLSNAIALNSTQFNAARMAGPAIGAVVISTMGIAACFYLNALSFLAVIGALLAMRPSELYTVPRAPRDNSFRQLKEGFRYARSTPEVVVILIVMGAIGAFGYNFQTLLPLVTKYVLDSGATTLALLTTTMGVGSIVAGAVVAYRGRLSQRLLLAAAGGFVVLLALVGLSSQAGVTAVLLFMIGFAGVLFMTTANTRLQLSVPGHMRGRVMGIYALLFVGTTPIGSLLIGQMAEHVGVQATVLAMAGLCGAGVVAGLVYARRTAPRTGGGGRMVPVLSGETRQRALEHGDAVEEGRRPA